MIKLFLKYIYQYRYTIILFAVFSVIFAVVFSLYSLEAEAVLYSCILCTVIGIIAVLNGFRKFIKKSREREYLMKNILIAIEKFPEPETVAEADYLEIIEKLRRVNSETETKFQNERQESIDYYTAWVHQIKTPISAMQMILQSEDTPEHHELLAELFRIEQYTGMVLSYFRLSENSSDFVFRNYELNDIIKKAVRKYAPQFMPLILAGIHVIFAFPIIKKILLMLMLTNTKLYIICTIISFLAFALIYVIIYLLTAKIYYKIVKR